MEHARNAGSGTVNPAESSGGLQVVPGDLRRERDFSVAHETHAFLVAGRVQERVPGKHLPQTRDVAVGDRPHPERAVDEDEDGHAL